MNMSLKTLAGAAVAITMSVSAPFAANAQDYSFKFQSSDLTGNPNFIIQQEWAERVGT